MKRQHEAELFRGLEPDVSTHNLILCHENTHTSLQFRINKSFNVSEVDLSYILFLSKNTSTVQISDMEIYIPVDYL